MKIEWISRAIHAVELHYVYILQGNPVAAEAFVERVSSAVNQLRDFPYLGRMGRVPGTREMVIPDYSVVVVYRLMHQRIEILHVLHTSRRWPEKL